MSTQSRNKLKHVLEAVPPGFLVTASWLADQGIAYETFRDYVKRGWLERVARGVFRRPARPGDPRETVDWQACVLSMQHILGYGVHVGAMSALGLHGYGHYLALGHDREVWLYGDNLPNWPSRVRLSAKLQTRTLSLFAESDLGLTQGPSTAGPRTSPDSTRAWSLTASTPERAILESLDEIPHHESLENLDKTFESLMTLRPRALTALLASCKRVKTKRLFFVLADRHDHPWRKHVRPEDFDLGKGDRALVRGGAIHPRYRIVIPREYVTATKADPTAT